METDDANGSEDVPRTSASSSKKRSPQQGLGWADDATAVENGSDGDATGDEGENEAPDTNEDVVKDLKELAGRLGREKLLRQSGRELEIQRLLMQKGARRKVVSSEDSPSGRVYRWRAERKR
jgi:hypothetical protein